MEDVIKASQLRSNLTREMTLLTVEDVNASTANEVEKELFDVKELLHHYCNSVRNIIDQNLEQLGADRVKTLDDGVSAAIIQFKTLTRRMKFPRHLHPSQVMKQRCWPFS